MAGEETFEDTAAALQRVLADCAARDDRAGYFAAMYGAVTRTVRARAAAGHFDDPDRMERFVARFAGRYLDAFDAWRAGRPVTESWRLAFEQAARWRPIALQHLLLGMNAHINLDLGVTAATFAGPDGAGLAAVRDDFFAVNRVLSDLVDACEGAVGTVSPWIGLADRVGGGGDETVIRFSLSLARQQAWNVAERLARLPEQERPDAALAVDAAAVRVGRRVVRPGLWPAFVLLLVRLRERARPAEIIRILDAVQL